MCKKGKDSGRKVINTVKEEDKKMKTSTKDYKKGWTRRRKLTRNFYEKYIRIKQSVKNGERKVRKLKVIENNV